jgi:hypothetical protein
MRSLSAYRIRIVTNPEEKWRAKRFDATNARRSDRLFVIANNRETLALSRYQVFVFSSLCVETSNANEIISRALN